MDTKVQNLDFDSGKSSAKVQKLDFDGKKLDTKVQNFDFEDQNLDIHKVEVKINTIDILSIINESPYSKITKITLLNICNKFFNSVFNRTKIIEYLNISKSSASNYINYLIGLNLVELVKGNGKGQYKFK